MSEASSACVSALLLGWISHFGVPDHITSNRGTPFMSHLWSSLMQLLGITLEDIESKVDAKLSIVESKLTNHFCYFFDNFNKSLEATFSNIDKKKLSQVMSSSIHDTVEQDSISSQDVTFRSFSAPFPVAVRFEHTSDKGGCSGSTFWWFFPSYHAV